MKIDTLYPHIQLPNWFDASYLLAGTPYQQEVYALLLSSGVFETLREYSPCLAGTIPLQVDTPESDADIVCEVRNHKAFREHVVEQCSHHAAFPLTHSTAQGLTVTLASFILSDNILPSLTVEIFGQSLAVKKQNAYRHLVVEARLLRLLGEGLAGEKAKASIRRLKTQGLKTEPAFAQYFGIVGEPYQALLDLYEASDEVLYKVIQKCQEKCQKIHTL